MICEWTLSANTNLKLVFFRFHTETGIDRVRVFDGVSASSSLIGVYYGSSLPQAITSSGNSLFIKFTSDSSVQKSGFAASYHGMSELQVCFHLSMKNCVSLKRQKRNAERTRSHSVYVMLRLGMDCKLALNFSSDDHDEMQALITLLMEKFSQFTVALLNSLNLNPRGTSQ